MENNNLNNTLFNYVDNLLEDLDFKNNSYFSALHDNKFDKEDFIETQIQFYTIAKFFPRFLLELVNKLPDSDLRLNIIENLYEDHCQGINKDNSNTFLSFLNSLGVSKQDIEKRQLWPETRMFIMSAWGTCSLDDKLVAASLLGTVEYMFLYISSTLEHYVLKNNWLSKEHLGYYTCHEKLDKKHAQDFFNLVSKSWEIAEEEHYYIKQGINLGAYSLNLLFNELYNHRKQRLYREIVQDHIRINY